MSFTKEKRDRIKFYILEKIEEGRRDFAQAASENFDISVNSVYRYVRELRDEGILKKQGKSYTLVCSDTVFKLSRMENELEDEVEIWSQKIFPLIRELPKNVRIIWEYAFTEMMNNAIEHSMAEQVSLEVVQNVLNTTVVIKDNGFGIFHKIQDFYRLPTQEEAIRELFKGKLTTDSSHHSGEGIFFTSRALDRFAAVSDGKIFSHDKFDDIITDFPECGLMSDWETHDGTAIYMSLSNYSKRILREVFDRYASVEEGFYKTSVPIKNMFDMTPVARSQARRLCRSFEKFTEIELDFDEIEEIGQGFAHELFVVYQREHPEIRLTPVNMNEETARMIRRVQVTAGMCQR